MVALVLAVAANGVIWAQTPQADIRSTMLMDYINTLEKDLLDLNSKRRDMARIQEQILKRIQWIEEKTTKVDGRVSRVQAQIARLVRSLVHMKQPDDLLLFFSMERYHDLHLFKRLVRNTTVSLLQRLEVTLRENQKDLGELRRNKEELATFQKRQAAVEQELFEVEGLISAKKADLAARQAKIAAVETLFMTQASVSQDGAEVIPPHGEKASNGPFSEAKGNRSLQIPISPGKVIKAFNRDARAPYGNMRMSRGWVLVPLVKESKKGKNNPESVYVRSPAEGKAVYSGDVPGFGLTLIIEHEKRYHTVYSNLHRVLVAKGELIKEGQAIASVRSADRTKVLPWVYFELREERLPVDPREWFRLRAVSKNER